MERVTHVGLSADLVACLP